MLESKELVIERIVLFGRAGKVTESTLVGRFEGRVKWFSDPKGYGFITREGMEDIFVHHSAINMEGFRTLKEGEAVIYDLMEGPKGLLAANVARKDGSEES